MAKQRQNSKTHKAEEAKGATEYLPSVEEIQQELGRAESIDDFFGKEGIMARLFARTLEQMLEGELTAKLGYERYAARGRNSGNSRNGKRSRKVQTSGGEVAIAVPRDRQGEYQPQLLERYKGRSNEIEQKVIGLYAKGMTTRDIQASLADLYGLDISAGTISTITEQVWPLVEEWQNRPLDKIYPIIYLDAIHIKLRQEGKVENVAVYIVLGVDLAGHRDVLGHWVSDGAEGANFWLSVISDLHSRGVEDIFIACVDGLAGFEEAIRAVFPRTQVQRCIIHQIRNSLKYVIWKDRKAFMQDLKRVYQAATRDEAENNLLKLGEVWGDKYAIAIRSWENNWAALSAYFDYPTQIRRLIYTTNAIEGYNRQLRKVTKNKAAFPSARSIRKLLYLANERITKKWTMPISNWAMILNQLAIRFEDRFPV
jgi:transposase-like protein